MNQDSPSVSLDILVIKGDKILLGLLNENWLYQNEQVYGVPGRNLKLNETIGDDAKRYIQQELGCNITSYKIISINANYALNNHYLGIGVLAEIDGEPKLPLQGDWIKWEWFDKNDLPNNLFPPARNVIESYINNKINVSE
ncbi:MAG: hypothetical protein KJ583_06280 [Nanoarchaeota archaeon]|nr:hypothetical protein [Nanoarchaeota archaeon]MBU1269372.1 hypothetical protein [Nanoarchaeota archaeon]MBU1604893.1 hypothetical protein [Nanoarchaeota archaeon]MBU2442686.1 hypothetical protein [Nanoarchaeota archaeon]